MSLATVDTLAVVRRFNEAFNRHDVDGIMEMMTADCVFASSPQAHFEVSDMFAAGDRAVVLWTYHWVKDSGPGHVRGVDVFRVRDGRVAEKLSYVKG